MLTIHLLPAARGDALWIEYGPAGRPHRVLIDGGIASTSGVLRGRIEALPVRDRCFDLLVITHIDLDHIAGVLALLRDPPQGLRFRDVWFNGWAQLLAAEGLADDGILGAKLGESVSARLRASGHPWNEAFGGGPVGIPDGVSPLPRRELVGGLAITLLSPTYRRLRQLRPVWAREVERAHLLPGQAGRVLEGLGHPEEADVGLLGGRLDVDALAASPFRDDPSPANGSSIAVLAEYDGRRCLLAGDAYASDLALAQGQVVGDLGDRLPTDAVKLSHHGGRKNSSRALLALLDCPRYLFSTDGSAYGHPHAETVARTIVHGGHSGPPCLYFNYRSEETAFWADRRWVSGEHRYTTEYGEGRSGLSVTL
jgi:hypothetical protein